MIKSILMGTVNFIQTKFKELERKRTYNWVDYIVILLLVLLFLSAVGFVILFPLIVVWAINTLFVLGIEYTFTNWVASIVLLNVIKPRSSKSE